jgi:hypothetical protein
MTLVLCIYLFISTCFSQILQPQQLEIKVHKKKYKKVEASSFTNSDSKLL